MKTKKSESMHHKTKIHTHTDMYCHVTLHEHVQSQTNTHKLTNFAITDCCIGEHLFANIIGEHLFAKITGEHLFTNNTSRYARRDTRCRISNEAAGKRRWGHRGERVREASHPGHQESDIEECVEKRTGD